MISVEEFQPFQNAIYMGKSDLLGNHPQAVADINALASDNWGREVSNSGGFQSHDLLLSMTLPMRSILEQVKGAVGMVFDRWGMNRSPECVGMWANINYKGNYNLSHTHPNTVMSAVYYLKCTPDSGNIVFERPDDQYLYFSDSIGQDESPFTAKIAEISPIEGGIVIFPAYFLHRVDDNPTDESRISIAFNFI